MSRHALVGPALWVHTSHVDLLTQTTLGLAMAMFAIACAPATDLDPQAGPFAVPEDLGEKADGYVSSYAVEYEITKTVDFEAPTEFDLRYGSEELQLHRAMERAYYDVHRQVERIVDNALESANSSREEGKLDLFTTAYTYIFAEADEVEVLDDEGRRRFTFRTTFIGSPGIPDLLTYGWGGNRFPLDTLEFTIRRSPTADAFPRYDRLFADGVFDIGVHFGSDYNEERFDLQTAEWLFGHLIEEGWTLPQGVEDYAQLQVDSPPFTRDFLVEGNPVQAQIFVTHVGMDGGGDASTRAMQESFRSRDVILYSGHAGRSSGFIFGGDLGGIEPDDMETIEMRDEYQIFILDGCRTQMTYVQELMANRAKTFDNVDIVTTVNRTTFTAGYDVLRDFIHLLTPVDATGSHYPLSWLSILRGVNERFPEVYYGVHGIENNPRLHPTGPPGVSCLPCENSSDCPGTGNVCLALEDGNGCGVACTANDACGPGMKCVAITDRSNPLGYPKQCVPADRSCG